MIRQSSRPPLRICVVVRELLGIGTPTERAASNSAHLRALRLGGDHLTVLWIPRSDPDAAAPESEEAKQFEIWRQRTGLHLERLPESPYLFHEDNSDEERSVAVYHYLKGHPFDGVCFLDSGGLGYYSMLAGEMGCFARRPWMMVFAHSPFAWCAEADRNFLEGVSEITRVHFERRSIERADALVCTGDAILAWMKHRGWSLPENTRVLPGLLPEEWPAAPDAAQSPAPAPVDELVFFGNATYRSGLTLFCDALDLLARRGVRCKVTLLGSFATIMGEHSGGMLLRRSRNWPHELKFVPEPSPIRAMDYLMQPGKLAVLPALASVPLTSVLALAENRIPFVSTSVGDMPGLLDDASRDRCLTEPRASSLADRLESVIGVPVDPPALALSHEARIALWRDYLDDAAQCPGAASAPSSRVPVPDGPVPLVSVILVHHDRPGFLQAAIDSVRCQDYPSIELVLVDDGSERPESHDLLNRLEPDFQRRGWRILREPNRYLGAARNTGVREARGDFILFLDDDNALFEHAVSSFVHAMQHAGADVCTCFSTLHRGEDPFPHPSEGRIRYFPMGESLELAMFYNKVGDANAMIRRTVFDRIGFLIEDYGYACQDWEFFTRAMLHDLKVRLLPEALYWYRESVTGMYRNSNWHDNRMPILKLFHEHKFKGLEYFYQPALMAQVVPHERESLHFNLTRHPDDAVFLKLLDAPPNSTRTLQLLAGIAATEGKIATSRHLMEQIHDSSVTQIAEELARVLAGAQWQDVAATATGSGFTPSPSLVGYLERVSDSSGRWTEMVGWVADKQPGRPLPRVAFFCDREFLGWASPDAIRPDVADALRARHLRETRIEFAGLAEKPIRAPRDVLAIAFNSDREFALLALLDGPRPGKKTRKLRKPVSRWSRLFRLNAP